MVSAMKNETTAATGSYAKIVVAPPGPKGQAKIAEYEEYAGKNNYKMHKMFLEKAESPWTLRDADGNVFIEGLTGAGVTVLGHANAEVMAAVENHLKTKGYMHVNNHEMYYEEYASVLKAVESTLPSPLNKGRGMLVNSGAEANEGALKAVANLTGKPLVMVSDRAFHGRTGAVLGATDGKNGKIGMDPLLGKFITFTHPYTYRFGGETEALNAAVGSIEADIKQHPNQIGAIMIEPVSGEPGVLIPPKGYYAEINRIARENGLMIIADEVQSGMGKTGYWWAIQNGGLDADFITTAKAVGGGEPLGGFFGKRELWDKLPAGWHASTFGGGPVPCVAGVATIDLIKRDKLVERAGEVGRHMGERLGELAEKYDAIGEVRPAGALIGMEITKNRNTREPGKELAEAIDAEAFKNGVLGSVTGREHNVLRLSFAYNVPMDLLDEVVGIYDRSIAAVVKK